MSYNNLNRNPPVIIPSVLPDAPIDGLDDPPGEEDPGHDAPGKNEAPGKGNPLDPVAPGHSIPEAPLAPVSLSTSLIPKTTFLPFEPQSTSFSISV